MSSRTPSATPRPAKPRVRAGIVPPAVASAVAAVLLASWLGAGVSAAVPPVAASAASAPAPGQPFPGLSPTEIASFERGRGEFERARSLEAGLGPLFNDSACNRCHNRKGVGGAGIQSAV